MVLSTTKWWTTEALHFSFISSLFKTFGVSLSLLFQIKKNGSSDLASANLWIRPSAGVNRSRPIRSLSPRFRLPSYFLDSLQIKFWSTAVGKRREVGGWPPHSFFHWAGWDYQGCWLDRGCWGIFQLVNRRNLYPNHWKSEASKFTFLYYCHFV